MSWNLLVVCPTCRQGPGLGCPGIGADKGYAHPARIAASDQELARIREREAES